MYEIRLSRAFACAFYAALVEGKIEAPKDVIEQFQILKHHYDVQMNRELT